MERPVKLATTFAIITTLLLIGAAWMGRPMAGDALSTSNAHAHCRVSLRSIDSTLLHVRVEIPNQALAGRGHLDFRFLDLKGNPQRLNSLTARSGGSDLPVG